MSIDWTPARKQRLRDLAAGSSSYEAIARILSAEWRCAVTKNAVVGQAHRMRLPPRPSPIIRTGAEPKQKQKPLARAAKARQRIVAPAPPVSVVAHAAPISPPQPKKRCGRCAWPMWPNECRPCPPGPSDRPTFGPPLFCDNTDVVRGAYCAAHAAIAFRERGERVA